MEINQTVRRRPLDAESVLFKSNRQRVCWKIQRKDERPRFDTWIPLEEDPALFRHFANGVYDAEDALAMFRKWGPLEAHEYVFNENAEESICESPERWVKAAEDARLILDIHDAIRSRDIKAMENLVGRLGPTPKGMFEAAEALMMALLNINFRGSVSPVITRVPGRLQGVGEVALAGTSLLGDIWLSAAREITGEVVILQCPQCHALFPQAKHNQKYCSPACTNRAFRDKRKEHAK